MTLILLLLACATDLPTFLETYDDDPTGGVVSPVLPPEPVYDEAKLSEVLAQMSADDAAAKAAALKAFPTVKVDEVRGKKYRSPKAAAKYINSRTSIHAEVITDMEDKVSTVLMQWGYVADNWLFFDRATVAVGDFRAKVVFRDTVRDNGSGGIWEYANLIFPAGGMYLPGMSIEREVAEKMTDAGKVTIRFEGTKHYDDYELKAWEKESIKAALVLTKKSPTRDDAIAVVAARPPETTP
jgi:hypothetical protein